MITHLISTTEFVKLLLNTSPYDLPDKVELNPLRVIYNYANFISQKPELWMFVPCDKEGNVLEEPEQYNSWLNKKSIDWEKVPFNVDLHTFERYKQAQSKVLFKGVPKDLIEYIFKYKSFDVVIHKIPKLELTETALKQIL